ncbi:MAG: choice-of-anchor I family protein [Fibrobacter sp.]|nr:choice-of-anchor I family protein [Fibrobacter sp.]
MKQVLLIATVLASTVAAQVFQKGSVLTPVATLQMAAPEISAYMPEKKMLFVVGGDKLIEMVSFADEMNPKVESRLQLDGPATSVTVHGDLVAVSITAEPDHGLGQVQLFRYAEGLVPVASAQRLCHLPDMVTFTPDGSKVLVACEGSPSADYNEDPEGGVAILSVEHGASLNDYKLTPKVLDFKGLDSLALRKKGVRSPGLQGFVRSLEPEYITVSKDSKWAWVSLQENNALAYVDIAAEKIADVFPLGYVDHSKPGFGLDVKKDEKVKIKNYPIRGLRQPDGVASFAVGGKTLVLTANEGASVNDYKAWTDEGTVTDLLADDRLDRTVFNDDVAPHLKKFTVSLLERCDQQGPDEVPGGKCPYVYGFGTRSVSLFDGETGRLLWDSGEELERAFGKLAPDYFNWNSKKDKVKMDSRSPKKGCEPENVTVGEVNGKRYAFVGLERSSGVAVFDLTGVDASARTTPKLVDLYFDPKDRGPEGLLFIPADKSPIYGQALLVVGYEFSKTLTVYTVK